MRPAAVPSRRPAPHAPPDFEVDRRGLLVRAGRLAEYATGLEQGELEGCLLARLLVPAQATSLAYRASLRRPKAASAQRFDLDVLHTDGTPRLVTVWANLAFDMDGGFAGATGRIVHVARHGSDEHDRFFESVAARFADDAVIVTESEPFDAPGPRVLYANDAACRMTGYARHEIVGHSPRLFQGSGTDPAGRARIGASLRRWEPVVQEMLNYRKDGTPFWVELSITPAADAGGYITHWVAVQRDITERKQLETELAEQRHRFAELAANLPGAMYRCTYDAHWRSLYLSSAFEQITGYALADYEGADALSFKSIVLAEDVPRIQASVRKAVDTRGSYEIEYRIRHTDGSVRWVQDRGRPWFDAEGKVRFLDGVFFDVTDQVLANERLRMLEAAVQDATESVLITDATERGTIVFANRGFERMTGYAAAEVVGRTPRLMQGPKTDPDVIERLRRNLREDEDFFGETINYRKDGTPFSIEWSISAVRDSDGEASHYVAVQRDVTARRAAEHQMRLLESAIESATDAVVVCEVQPGKNLPVCTYANPAFFALNGYEPRDPVEIGPDFLLGPESDRQQVEKMRRLFETGTPGRIEGPTYRKDGSVIQSEVSLAPVANRRGEVSHWVVVQRDVTHMRRYEAERAARERAEEMVRAKNAFFDNLSHEIRTPLTAILGAADILEHDLAAEQREFAEMIQTSGERLLYTLDSFLDLARLEGDAATPNLQPAELLPLVQSAARLHQSAAVRKGLPLHVRCDRPAPAARVDASDVQSALAHVIGNAVKFTDAGHVEVHVTQDAAGPLIRVRDTGVGIAPEFLPRAFEPFAQQSGGLTRAYEGNGLGLAIARRLMERMGGSADAQSREGAGTTVTLRLPAA